MKKLKEFHWFCIFFVIFLLAYLPGFGWSTYKPMIAGIPFWVWYVAFLTIILSVAGGLFVRFFLRDSNS